MAKPKLTIEFYFKDHGIVDAVKELSEILDSIEEDFPWNKELSEARTKLMYIFSELDVK